MAERQPKRSDISPAGLVALLDLVERPAAAVSDTGTILGVNQSFHDLARAHGVPPHDQLRTVLRPDSVDRTLALLEPRAPRRVDVDLELHDGTPIAGRVEVLTAANGAKLLFVVLETPRARGLEMPLRGTAALRHDIAGPLTAILGTAELLLLRGGDQLPREIRDSIGQILENCGRISEILHKSRASDREQSGGES